MTQLSPYELSHLIGLVYDSALEDQQWQRLLDAIRAHVPEIFTAVIGFDGMVGKPIYVHSGIADDYVESYLNGQMLNNETARYMMDLPVGAIATTSDTIPQDEYVAFDFYKNWLAPQGMGPGVGAILAKSQGRFAAINFAMPHAVEDQVLQRLVPLLELLVPHMVRAQELARTLKLSQSVAGVLKGLFDTLVLPMIVTDAEGRHQFANVAGQRMLARRGPVSLDAAGFVDLHTRADTDELRAKIAATCNDVCVSSMRVGTHSGAPEDHFAELSDAEDMGLDPVAICLTPFKTSLQDGTSIDADIFAQNRLCAIIIGQTDWSSVSVGLLQDAFDLTRREAEVCRLLLSSQSPEDMAAQFHRSVDTIRTQIKTVYRKTGARSRAELQDSLSVFRTVGTLFDGPE